MDIHVHVHVHVHVHAHPFRDVQHVYDVNTSLETDCTYMCGGGVGGAYVQCRGVIEDAQYAMTTLYDLKRVL